MMMVMRKSRTKALRRERERERKNAEKVVEKPRGVCCVLVLGEFCFVFWFSPVELGREAKG